MYQFFKFPFLIFILTIPKGKLLVVLVSILDGSPEGVKQGTSYFCLLIDKETTAGFVHHQGRMSPCPQQFFDEKQANTSCLDLKNQILALQIMHQDIGHG